MTQLETTEQMLQRLDSEAASLSDQVKLFVGRITDHEDFEELFNKINNAADKNNIYIGEKHYKVEESYLEVRLALSKNDTIYREYFKVR